MKKKALAILVLLIPMTAGGEEAVLRHFAKIRTDPDLQTQLRQVVAAGIERAFGRTPTPKKIDEEYFSRPLPLFVTLKKGEDVRGCMGSLQAREKSLDGEIHSNLTLALFQDPRHRRVSREEIPGMEVYLTAVGQPVPVRGIGEISPARDGAYIRQGRREAVVLPGEAKTQRYLLAFLKSKAGIKRGPYQLFRFQTETVRVQPDVVQISKSS